jgi:hypothetical protein
MAELELNAQSCLQWGPETACGLRVLSEIDQERRDGGDAGLKSDGTVPGSMKCASDGSGPQTSVEFLPGVELPPNVALLARTTDAAGLRRQAELVRVRLPPSHFSLFLMLFRTSIVA